MIKRLLTQGALFLIGLAVCYALMSYNIISTSMILIIQYVGIYTIFAMGINLVNGYLGIFSLAHAGIMAVGGYAASLFSMYVLKAPGLFPVSLIIGGLCAAAAGLLIALPSFTVKGDYLAIITLGFSLIVKSILQNLEVVGGPRGLRPIPKNTNLLWVYGCVMLAVLIVSRFTKSKYGRSMFAIREDQVASELVSVDIKKVKLVTFSVSAFLIGIAGALVSHLLAYTNPDSYGYSTIVDGLVIVYLGGVGSITGSFIGAMIWQVLVQSMRSIGAWRWIIGGFLLVLIMIFRPSGIFGNKELRFRGIADIISRKKKPDEKRSKEV